MNGARAAGVVMRAVMCGGAAVAFAAALLACPPDDKKAPAPAAPSACAKVGQSCEFAPGKLGTCVQKDDCKTGDCFVCQSQH